MTSSDESDIDHSDIQSTPPPVAEKQPDPWRKHRILAGILTAYVGLHAAYTVILYYSIALSYGFLSGVLSGLGSPSRGVTISLLVIVFVLAIVIGGLMFCGKKGRGRLMVCLAALISVPISLYAVRQSAFVPGRPTDRVFVSVLIALVISIYLIWVLRKTAPNKENLRARALRMATPRNLAATIGVVGVVLAMTYWDEISNQYSKKYWEPSEVLAGLSVGMPKSEVYRLKGAPYALPNNDWASWHFTTSKRPDLVVGYANDLVTEIWVINLRANVDGIGCSCRQGKVCDPRSCNRGGSRGRSTGDRMPFRTIAQMHEILGEEDILAISADYSPYGTRDRISTYAEWEVSYRYSDDVLVGVGIGHVSGSRFRNGEYFVKGRQVCPSEACPWDDEGNLKPEYEGANYRDFFRAFSSAQ